VALKDILNKIIKDAEDETAKINTEAEKEIKRLNNKAAREIETERLAMKSRTRERRRFLKEQKEIEMELDTKKEILSKKQAEIDNIFNEVLRAIGDLPDKDYVEIIRKLLKKTPHGREGVFVIPKKRLEITEKEIKKVIPNAKFDASSKIEGGFIIKTKETEIDNSFASLLAQIKEDLEKDVADILFG